jgi:hypothetical protein
VNGTKWQIQQGCPQCGAPVTLEETDRLLACPFCRVRLYLAPERNFRYLIPPASGGEGELFYIPYWRLRGSSFTISPPGVTNRFVDTSALAADIPGLPHSLGLRPQVLKLRFVTPSTEGRFIRPELSADRVLPGMDAPAREIFHRVFIGESVSLIYAPLLLRDKVLRDAFLDKPLCSCGSNQRERLRATSAERPGSVRFVPTLCPHCGWNMEGGKESLVLLCRNCNSAWSCPEGSFERVEFVVIRPPPGTEGVATHLPFWRMKPRIEGIGLTSYADLIRIANLPKAIVPAFSEAPLYFWSPAFKIQPALYLRWARQMTVFRPAGDADDLPPGTAPYPVTLPLRDASEGIVPTLAQMITDRQKLYPRLAGLRITIEASRLEYHPFIGNQNELIHPALRVALDRTALAFGIGL